MHGQDLTKLLCLMHPGMRLTVPDEWLEQNIPGTKVQRANRIERLAGEFSCALLHGMGTQTFERIEYPRLG